MDIENLKKQATAITNLYNSKNYIETIDKGKRLIKKFPNQIIFYNATSLALSAEGQNDEAIKLLNKALRIDPKNIYVLNNLGLIKFNMNLDEDSEIYLKKAIEVNPNFFDALLNYGNLFLKKNEIENAENIFLRASQNASNKFYQELINMSFGNLYQQTGNFIKAIKHYQKVLELNPLNTMADKSISLVHQYKNKEDDHLRKMENKIKSLKNSEDLQRIYFALGKAYEDIKDYRKSFEFIEKANQNMKKKLKFQIKDEIKLFNSLQQLFLKRDTKPLDKTDMKLIFIVGMPRSGTTLTEQIISSHKDVYGAGELPFLTETLERNFMSNPNFLSDIKQDFNHEKLMESQRYFLDRITNLKNTKKIITDKAPLNFKWIGFIKILFPNSKIIHCTRDPIDISWSNFKNSFSSKNLGFTYNLEDLGNYFNLYKNLMKFWNNKFPKEIYNLSYEKLIEDQKSEIKKLINFCELTWDESCLKPHENKKAVATASLAQVRSPIYKSSIKKWKNYSNQLKILNKIIKAD